jgi:hypothetical protein
MCLWFCIPKEQVHSALTDFKNGINISLSAKSNTEISIDITGLL